MMLNFFPNVFKKQKQKKTQKRKKFDPYIQEAQQTSVSINTWDKKQNIR